MENQCRGCGFFCFVDNGVYSEAKHNWRDIDRRNNPLDPRWSQKPCCYLAKVDIVAEVKTDAPERTIDSYHDSLSKERDCGEWTPYMEGHSPQQHAAVRDISVERMGAKLTAEFQKQMVDVHRQLVDVHRQLGALDQVHHNENRDDSRQSEQNVDRRHHATLLIQFLLALLAAVVALIGNRFLS